MSKWEQPIDRANEEIEKLKARAEAAEDALDVFKRKYKPDAIELILEGSRLINRWKARAEAAERDAARYREALKPFAEAADSYEPEEGDSGYIAWAHDFTIGSLRRARAALEAKP